MTKKISVPLIAIAALFSLAAVSAVFAKNRMNNFGEKDDIVNKRSTENERGSFSAEKMKNVSRDRGWKSLKKQTINKEELTKERNNLKK